MPFQLRTEAVLGSNRNVILQAPTGSGKTWAALAPFLYARSVGRPIADRVLYALPLRSLATSLYNSTREDIAKCSLLEGDPPRVSIQTGESPDDQKFEADIVFTTIDQLLSSYLQHPVGLPDRCGNLNGGAIPGALVVFDEFHLLDAGRAMGTAIEMLQTFWREQPLTQFVVMTATLSRRSLEWLARELKAEIVDVPPDELAELHNEQGRVRRYEYVPEPLTAEAVIAAHGGNRSIVIVNSVTKAQALYRELSSEDTKRRLGEGVEVRLLHSRFFEEDRRRIESDLAEWFGPKGKRSNIVLVSTQTIEAGMDFSCENLHTEVAPLNAVIQRAGRCARRRCESGRVRVYDLETNDKEEPRYGAYRPEREVVDATRTALIESVSTPKPLSFPEELELIDRVHTETEQRRLAGYANIHARRKEVRKAMADTSNACLRELVRDIQNVNVVVTDEPERLRFDGREWPELLSISSLSLSGLLGHADAGSDWVFKAARDADVEGPTLRFNWVTVQTEREVRGEAWLLAINPRFARYSHDVGLELGVQGDPVVRTRARAPIHRYSYTKETYAQHVANVVRVGMAVESRYAVTTRRLAGSYGVAPEMITDWLRCIWALHDVGKLSTDWQEAIWAWQDMKTPPDQTEREPLAHSDYDPARDFEASKAAPRRPPHAAEGAFAAAPAIVARFGDQNELTIEAARAAVTAIATHHGPRTIPRRVFRLMSNATETVRRSFAGDSCEINLNEPTGQSDIDEFAQQLFSPTDMDCSRHLPLYLYFCRRLRLADQGSFEETR